MHIGYQRIGRTMGNDTTMDNNGWELKFKSAQERIAGLIKRTPMYESKGLSERLGVRVFLKLENEQVTGSFKARGAIHKLLSLSPEQRARGVIAASSGNHGAAVAYGASQLGCPATIYVPSYAAEVKKEAIARYGAEVRVQGDDCVETEVLARGASVAQGQPYVPPYNDSDVMAGQGTVAVEMLEEFPALDAYFVALGGGNKVIKSKSVFLKKKGPWS